MEGAKGGRGKNRQWVALSGVGGLGQMAIQYAVTMGLHVIAVDVSSEKLWRAKDLGAEITLNVREEDVVRRVQSEVGGAHGVIVTAASLKAFREAIDMTRRDMRACRLPPGEFSVPLFDVVLVALWSALVRTSRRRCRLAPILTYGPTFKRNRWKR
jgi:propanol-preferring alcohol dehydrogenase